MNGYSNMKTYYVTGYYKFLDMDVRRDAAREIKAENIAGAISKFNTYNTKIYGADVSTVSKVFECVWN